MWQAKALARLLAMLEMVVVMEVKVESRTFLARAKLR
jgi:hypothetical protein